MFEIRQPRQAGIFVRRARTAQGMTQRQLAETAGVSERSVLSLEMGDATGIRLDKLLAILDALGTRLAVPDIADSDCPPATTPDSACSANRGDTEDADTPSEPTPSPCNSEGAHRPQFSPGLSSTPYQQLFDEFARKSQNRGTR